MELWINPSCSKCRVALAEVEAAGVEHTVRRYLDDPPTAGELAEVVARLGVEPWQVAREKEAAEVGIDLPRDAEHRTAWLEALAAHPRAIQRPIVLTDDGGGVVARDADSLARVLSSSGDDPTAAHGPR